MHSADGTSQSSGGWALLSVECVRWARLAGNCSALVGGERQNTLSHTHQVHIPCPVVCTMQVTSPQAVGWLLVQLGVQSGGSRPGLCSTATASPHTPSSVPADTLQLVLDFTQTHLAKMAAAADSTSTAAAATPSAAALMLSPGLSSGRSSNSSRGPLAAAADSAPSTAGLSVPLLAALQQRNSTPGGASVFVLQLKANCWLLLSRVLLLAACQPAVRPPGELGAGSAPRGCAGPIAACTSFSQRI